MSLMNIKSELLRQLTDNLNQRIETLQSEYKLYMDSAANETKSTAGDKHDTSRSMMQLEQEKLGSQLNQMKLQKQVLEKIDPHLKSNRIQFGSIVYTDKGNFFISISSTKPLEISGEKFTCISIQSPIGQSIIGSSNQVFEFMGKTYKIISYD